ncbi:Adenylosuccinate synthetase [Dirofilaria immitis]
MVDVLFCYIFTDDVNNIDNRPNTESAESATQTAATTATLPRQQQRYVDLTCNTIIIIVIIRIFGYFLRGYCKVLACFSC